MLLFQLFIYEIIECFNLNIHNSSTIKHRTDRISIRENILMKMKPNQKKSSFEWERAKNCKKEPQTTNPPSFRCNTHGLFVMLLNGQQMLFHSHVSSSAWMLCVWERKWSMLRACMVSKKSIKKILCVMSWEMPKHNIFTTP